MRIATCVVWLIFTAGLQLLSAQEPGLIVEAYQLPGPVQGVPELVPGQRPNAVFTISAVNLEGNRIFGDFQQDFFFRIRGQFVINDPDTYKFRLSADDWARISINKAWLADTDDDSEGIPQMRQFDLALEKGTHDLEIWYYNGDRTKRLKWEWFIKGIRSYVAVPKEILTHTPQTLYPYQPGIARLYSPQARSIPGDQQALAGLHPGLTQSNAMPENWQAGISGMVQTKAGMLVSTWADDGSIYMLPADPDSSPSIVWRALDLPTSLGESENGLWVLQQSELTLLRDTDDDGTYDQFDVKALFKLAQGERAAQALAVKDEVYIVIEGNKKSRLMRLKANGELSKVRSEVGRRLQLAADADGTHLWLLDQGEDQWSTLKKLNPKSQDETIIALIPPSIMQYPGGILPLTQGPYAGDILLGDQGQGGLRRLHVDENGHASLLRFSRGLTTVPALMKETDAGFLVGGQQLPGLTEAPGTRTFGLDNMSWGKGDMLEIQSLTPTESGIWVNFNQALHPIQSITPDDIDVLNFGLAGQASQTLKAVKLQGGEDPSRLFIETGSLSPQQLLYVHFKKGLFSQSDAPLLSSEAWCYVSKTLRTGPATDKTWTVPGLNRLTEEEVAAGWKLLFNGTTTEGWRNPHQSGIHPGWQVEEGALVRAGDGAGDIISAEEYDAFELRLDWKISAGGNSGVFFHVGEGEAGEPIYITGPEMQILDDLAHPDRRYHSHRAGSNYDLHPAAFEALNPVGEWNEARLIVRPDGRVEHWLNGYRIVSYTLGDEAWEQRVKASKFASMPDYGRLPKGHIGLQDHGDKVSFRNIKIHFY